MQVVDGNNIIGDNMREINNENDILEYVFNVICNGIGLYCDVNNEMDDK